MMVFLNGEAITEPARVASRARRHLPDPPQRQPGPGTFTLPGPKLGRCWNVTLDTRGGPGGRRQRGRRGRAPAGGQIELAGHSMMVLRRTDPAPAPLSAG
jgi:hypothetical protein